MDRIAMKEAMITSISEVLETMFFLPLDILEPESEEDFFPGESQNLMGCTLGFGGPFDGGLAFLIPLPLARTLTADFVGEDREAISERTVEETIKELLNMITGKTLSLFDSQALFRLELPEIMEADKMQRALTTEEDDDVIILVLNTMNERIIIKMAART